MRGLNAFKSGILICATAASLAWTGSAMADTSASDAVLERLAALEARIAALETTNREYKREIDEARTQARHATSKAARLSYAALPASGSTPSSAISVPPTPWSGLVWGGSAGGAAIRSRVVSGDQTLNTFPPGFSGNDSVAMSGPARGAGALTDVFVGWNTELSKSLVVGGQLEVTAANLDFSSSGTKNYTYFDQNGPTGNTAIGNFRPQVTSRWMTSALLRAGVLLDERTLLYAVGGWTLAQFENRNVTDNPFYQPQETFMASGWTAGTGIERKLDSHWSVRAEYRYTQFGTQHTTDNFLFQTSFATSQSYRRDTQYDLSMQAGRIGIAYTFNPFM